MTDQLVQWEEAGKPVVMSKSALRTMVENHSSADVVSVMRLLRCKSRAKTAPNNMPDEEVVAKAEKSRSKERDINRQKSPCRRCGVILEGHPICICCGILIGPAHIETYLVPHRKLEICSFCANLWVSVEKRLGHTVALRQIMFPKGSREDQ
jgi:hypothetical protein